MRLAILSILLFPITTFAQNIQEGLITHYKFDGTAIDSSHSENHGTIHGATPTADRFGNTSGALSFDGIDDYVDIGLQPEFNSSLDSFSISFWLKHPTPTVYSSVFKTLNSNPDRTGLGLDFHLQHPATLNTDQINFHLRSSDDQVLEVFANAPVIADTNDWHMFTYVVSGSQNNDIKIYIDNTLMTNIDVSSDSPVNFNPFQHPLTIGAGNVRGTIQNFFAGEIDDFRIYDRPLTLADLNELYRESNIQIDSGLIAHYPFNQNTNDESPNGYDADNFGASLTIGVNNELNGGYDFDGLTDYMTVDDLGLLSTSIANNTGQSYSLFFKPSQLPSKIESLLGSLNNAGNGTLLTLQTNHSPLVGGFDPNHIMIHYRDESGHDIKSYAISDALSETSEWHHLAVVVYSTNPFISSIFIDGNYLNTITYHDEGFGSNYNSFQNSVAIGSINNRGTIANHFTGQLDEIRFYNRALSKDEINELKEHESIILGKETVELIYPTSIYPNPSTGSITLDNFDRIHSVKIIDATGVSVYSASRPTQTITGLDSGMYIVHSVLKSGETITERLIVK